jgi:hypothetical protein
MPLRRLGRQYRLNNACNRLNKSEDNREYQDKCRNPERVPLDFLTIVSPPMPHTRRFGIIERLLQNPQAFPPILELFEPPL